MKSFWVATSLVALGSLNLCEANTVLTSDDSATSSGSVARQTECKCYSTDSCWPADDAWASLNDTVNGYLRKVVPPGASCYQSFEGTDTYDQQACSAAISGWTNLRWHLGQDFSAMWPIYTNNTCNPATGRQNSVCGRGNYPEYVIVAQTPEHIQAGVNFARENKLRLIIRNTGHDFLGRSTGFGALAINTHSFQTSKFETTYSGPGDWTGGAVTVGAGIQTRQLYELANKQGPSVLVVGGECETVGIAGGYIASGGHSPMSSRHGMGADNTLSFGVVTAAGDIVTANAEENSDLFWALSGGGPSTFGIVYSATLKTFPEIHSAGATLDITTQDQDLFWRGMEIFTSYINTYIDAGMYVLFNLGSGFFSVAPFLAPNTTKAQIDEILSPLLKELDSNKVPYKSSSSEYPTFYDLYAALFTDDSAGMQGLLGGWVFSRDDIKDNHAGVAQAWRKALSSGASGGFVFIGGHVIGPGVGVPKVNNAMHPGWRNAAVHNFVVHGVSETASPAQREQVAERITTVIDGALRNASTSGLSYLNEGDPNEPNWQSTFWGDNYARLLEIKHKWDPEGVFWAKTTPGSEAWAEVESGTKLCRTA